MLFHLSLSDLNTSILKPQVPKNFLTSHKYEDSTTPRISFCRSIDGCLIGLSANIANTVFNVYTVDRTYTVPLIKEPTVKEVPDVLLTREVWVLNSIKLKYLYPIKVLEAKKALTYKYGNNKVATTYSWNYIKLEV